MSEEAQERPLWQKWLLFGFYMVVLMCAIGTFKWLRNQ